MTFINETKFILKKSDNNLVVFNIDDNIRYKVLDYNLDTLSSETLYKGKFSYIVFVLFIYTKASVQETYVVVVLMIWPYIILIITTAASYNISKVFELF